MKKVNQLLIMGALALTAGFTMTSCSSDDAAEADVNPTYDGQSVKTQFALNVSMPQGTRMSASNTQQGVSPSFLGINEIHLYPFTSLPDGDASTFTRNISLSDMGNAEISTAKSNKVYSDVEIPVGTTHFLFYGFGPKGTTQATMFEKGIMTTNFPSAVSASVDGITASLNTILTENVTTIQGYYTDYLKGIKDVSGWSEDTPDITLSDAYRKFTKFGSNGVICGSANAILKTVESLYNVAIDAKSHSTSQDIKDLADAIMTKITTSTGNITVVLGSVRPDGKHYDLKYENDSDPKYLFPTTFGLPEGAAQLTCDGTNYAYKNEPTIGGLGNILNIYGLTYPVSLAYTANTTLRASTKSNITSWPVTVDAWDSNAWTDWTDKVVSTTRTVALKNNINYSVACLETTVKCDQSTLKDNRAAIVNDGSTPDQSVPVGTGFQVTGVLIGGQPEKVDWQFLDKESSRKAVIYDRDVTSMYAKGDGSNSNANYTLVFDNWKNATQEDNVLIALELVNNSTTDFYGVDGIILKGQKFYLVAKLELSSGAGTIEFPANAYQYPKSGTKRIFMQDYTTKAKLTIKSLQNAYSTIPDLRSIQLQLGLSVDLQWRSGLTFNVDIN